ncbi:CPBP family intramembrane metalloprotease [Tychonema sp. LEGE 07199]|uniref:CPBP family intramembrane glutamic endopeptidase n=1 Tax=unclassified Tychonema TaxID=2642144 RepID=UPI0018819E6E|nr:MULTISPECIES: type II CAAX endopeptidase family protein [unclassified Tychonema]MBE9122565.1 CPBP family intramembrane metalloprotease [Tychonema sp. LEGE 07199]MBE9131206.1 CPBP family intramembrane metalloprotease [Tychonema sp. LEGE 07196]
MWNSINNLRLMSPSIPAIIKIILFFATWIAVWLPVATVVAIALKWHPPQPLGNKKLPLLASLYLIVPFILWATSWIENTSFASWGWDWQPAVLMSLLEGLGLGIISLVILFGLQLTAGWIELKKSETSTETGENNINFWALIINPASLLTLLLGLWISATEELIFRGCLQTILQQDYSILIAGAIASFIFAIAHLIWAAKETLPQLPGLWLMGMVLTLARIADNGSLGLATGIHAAWIWGITTVDTEGAIKPTSKVPEWITGIAAKPLAGAAGILLLLATAAVLLLIKN